MIKIAKKEAFKMRELGFGKDVHKTYSKHPTYYLTEDKKALEALCNYRQSSLIYEVK